jgi:uncharacterized Tic20 family protein
VTEPGSGAPPGWYRDHTGYLRWWDGSQWGPYAPPPPAPQDAGQALSVVSHLGTVAGWVILPLVVYLTEGKKNSFVRHHAREALNFQLTFLIVYVGASLVFFGSFFLSPVLPIADDGFFTGFVSPFPLVFLVWIGALAFSVLGAVRASQRQWWRYPVAIRFVKDEPTG